MTTSPASSRFSQAQILIAALFSVVMSGNMPQTGLPVSGEVMSLEEEFADIFIESPKRCRSRLADASIFWKDGNSFHHESYCRLCKHLCQMPILPSALAREIAFCIEERTGLPTEEILRTRPLVSSFKGLRPELVRRYGVDPAVVPACWERPDDMDKAWKLCRAELLVIRAERAALIYG